MGDKLNNTTGIQWYESNDLESEDLVKDKNNEAIDLITSIERFHIKKGDKMLDVGCGNGLIGAEFKRSKNIYVSGMDLSPKSVEIAKKYGINAVVADIDQEWPYPASSFDILLGVEIVEHIFNTDNFFSESRRVLKKNGLLIITTPNLAAWFNRILLLVGYQPFFTEVSTKDKTMGLGFTRKLTPNRETVGHLRVFTLKALEDMLHSFGFDICMKKGKHVGYFPSYISIADKVFTKFPSLAADMLIVAKNVK